MPIQRFIQRPEQVEAMPAHELFDAAQHDRAALPEWARDAYDTDRLRLQEDGTVIMASALGHVSARGDDVIFFQGGSLKRLSAAEFAEAYAPAPAEDVTP